MLSYFLTILVVRKKIKVKLAPAILTGAPTTLADEITQTLPLVILKTIKTLLNFLVHDFLWLIS